MCAVCQAECDERSIGCPHCNHGRGDYDWGSDDAPPTEADDDDDEEDTAPAPAPADDEEDGTAQPATPAAAQPEPAAMPRWQPHFDAMVTNDNYVKCRDRRDGSVDIFVRDSDFPAALALPAGYTQPLSARQMSDVFGRRHPEWAARWRTRPTIKRDIIWLLNHDDVNGPELVAAEPDVIGVAAPNGDKFLLYNTRQRGAIGYVNELTQPVDSLGQHRYVDMVFHAWARADACPLFDAACEAQWGALGTMDVCGTRMPVLNVVVGLLGDMLFSKQPGDAKFAVCLYGGNGNGKSLFVDVLRAFFSVKKARAKLITSREWSLEDVAKFNPQLLIFEESNDAYNSIDEFKMLVDGAPQLARIHGESSAPLEYKGKLIMASNKHPLQPGGFLPAHLFEEGGRDVFRSVQRRLAVVHVSQRVEERRRDMLRGIIKDEMPAVWLKLTKARHDLYAAAGRREFEDWGVCEVGMPVTHAAPEPQPPRTPQERIVDILVRRDGARELTLNGVIRFIEQQNPRLHADLMATRNGRLWLTLWRRATGNEFNCRTDRTTTEGATDYKFYNYTLP